MDPLTWVSEAVSAIENAVVALGPSPWLLLVVLILCWIDGFFPPVPSESIVIAGAALAVTTADSAVFLTLLALAAAAGALAGDLTAYAIGGRIPLERMRIFKGRRGSSVLNYARYSLQARGSTFILVGRFVPVGRVAVNMTAGAVEYPKPRFLAVASLASVLWSGFSLAMGLGSGMLFQDSPVLAMAAGVGAGLFLGLIIDKVLRTFLPTAVAAPGDAGVVPAQDHQAGVRCR